MLTTVENVLLVPGATAAGLSTGFLEFVLGGVDAAVKSHLKRDVELGSYEEYPRGGEPDLILSQYPVWVANTAVAAASSGAVLPQATIYVASTKGFPPGTGSNPDANPPAVCVQTGNSTWTWFTYTGVTPNPAQPNAAPSFTGCSGGAGTLSSTNGFNRVATPVIFSDGGGSYGQGPGSTAGGVFYPPFSDRTILAPGSGFSVPTRPNAKEPNCGLVRCGGGGGAAGKGAWGSSLAAYYGGKLAASRVPSWTPGEGNIKVLYGAGYAPGKVPLDLQMAVATLCFYAARNMPQGAALSSESLGAYSYSLVTVGTDIPEVGSAQNILAKYREVSW
jgi:hypothetical protein